MGVEHLAKIMHKISYSWYNFTPNDYFEITSTNKPVNLFQVDYIFLDFNSIIHTVISDVINIVNNEFKKQLIQLPNKTLHQDINIQNIMNLMINNYQTNSTVNNSMITIFLEQIVIDQLIRQIDKYIKICNTDKLHTIYIAIDGVPSKAKMTEQRKRRYTEEFINQYKNKIFKDLPQDNIPMVFNKYKILKNRINLLQGSSFMEKFKQHINTISIMFFSNLEVLISSSQGEGEMLIIDYIKEHCNTHNSSILFWSPDADVILLSMLLNCKVFLLRQITTDKAELGFFNISTLTDTFYNKIKKILSEQSKDITYLKKQNVINDIVFLFTFFGNDFLPKIEAINIMKHISQLLNIYSTLLVIINTSESITFNYLVNEQTVNNNFLFELVNELSKVELDNLQKMYLEKTYSNYSKLVYTQKLFDKTSQEQYDILKDQLIFPFVEKSINEYDITKIKNAKSVLEEKQLSLDILYGEDANKLELNDIVKLGNLDDSILEQSKRYYSQYFIDNSTELHITQIVSSYVDGLIWIWSYYYKNERSILFWSYPYVKSPLMRDIALFLKDKPPNYFNIRLSKLQQNYGVSYQHQFFSPIEHFLYVSPIDVENLTNFENDPYLKTLLFDTTSIIAHPNGIIGLKNNIIGFLKQFHTKYPQLHFSISKIIKNIDINKTSNKTKEISCVNSRFLSQCNIKQLHVMDASVDKEFIKQLRQIIKV
jgi:5'-3' exonuclease